MRARCAGRAGEAGLVTLEWLLIVAALAGLAALAVVLVQHVVDDTAEQVGASSARRTAAAVAALEVERQARAATTANPRTATWADWESYFSARCDRLAILYRDAAVEVDTAFAWPTAAGGADPISEAVLVSATEADPTGSTAQVRCNVDEPDGAVAADAAPPLPSIEDFRLAAQAIADAAATLRPGDAWATWKAHFEPLCSEPRRGLRTPRHQRLVTLQQAGRSAQPRRRGHTGPPQRRHHRDARERPTPNQM